MTTDLALAYGRCAHDNNEDATPLFVSNTNVPLIRELLVADPWRARCARCGSKLRLVRPVVFIDQDRKRAWVTSAVLKMAPERIARRFGRMIERRLRGFEVTEIGSAKELRRAVASHLTHELETAEIFIARDIVTSVTEHWRRLTAAFFAALLVSGTENVPFPLRRQLRTPDTIREDLSRWQALVWSSFVVQWVYEAPNDSFEADLARFIAPTAMLPDVVPKALTIIDAYGQQSTRVVVQYTTLAVRASICSAAAMPNSEATIWAAVLLGFEAKHRRKPAPSRRIAPSRIAATLTLDAVIEGFLVMLTARSTIIRQSGKELTGEEPEVRDLIEALEHVLRHLASPSLEEMLAAVEKLSNIGSEPSFVAAMIGMATESWVETRRLDDLERLADVLIARGPADVDFRAQIESWFGRCCKNAETPRRFLARVGDTPAEWEHATAPRWRATLLTERANNLRLLGRLAGAIAAQEEAAGIFPPDESERDRLVADRNRAVMSREDGMVNQTADALETLLPQIDDPEDRAAALHSLVISHLAVNEYDRALAESREAVEIATQISPAEERVARSTHGMVCSVVGEVAEAVQQVALVPIEMLDMRTLGSLSSTVLNLVQRNDLTPEQESVVLSVADEIADRIPGIAADSLERGNLLLHVAVLRIDAQMAMFVNPSDAAEKSERLVETARELDLPVEPDDLLLLAYLRLLRDDTNLARQALLDMPAALARQTGLSSDILRVSTATERHQRPRLREMATRFAARSEHGELRLVGELSRDAIGRARQMRQRSSETGLARLREVLAGGTIPELVTRGRVTAVLEWVDLLDATATLLTTIDESGNAVVSWLAELPADVAAVGRQAVVRVEQWSPGREGDPFDFADFRHLSEWLEATLREHVAADAHLVFIEHPGHAGLPWHIVARPWTSSYARSWASLLLFDPPAAAHTPAIGAIMVHGATDSATLVTALQASREAAGVLATRQSLRFETVADPGRTDIEAVQRILETTTHAKLLCHGFVSPRQQEVAIVLSSGGKLPESPPIAEHLLGWRQFERFRTAPRVVFSAACSSGVSHTGGLGERVGLFAGLQRAGTRTLVAPRWKLYAKHTLPLLDRVMEQVVAGAPVAETVHRVATQAELSSKRWLAWTLAVEGDWR